MDRPKTQSDNLFAYLAATAPALFQLVAVLSVGLTNVLNLNKFVFFPEFLNIANLFVVLFTLIFITLSYYWDTNRINLHPPKNPKKFDFTLFPRIFWNVFYKVVILAVVSSFLFIGILLNKTTITTNINVWGTVQWIAYIVALTAISFSIYVFTLLKIQEKNGKLLQENFVPRLMDSLRRYGYVRNPDIRIVSINIHQEAVVIIENNQFRIYTTVEGEMVAAEFLGSVPTQTATNP